jgi:hypothetical protein
LSGRGLGSSATVGAALNELDLMASARDLTVSASW